MRKIIACLILCLVIVLGIIFPSISMMLIAYLKDPLSPVAQLPMNSREWGYWRINAIYMALPQLFITLYILAKSICNYFSKNSYITANDKVPIIAVKEKLFLLIDPKRYPPATGCILFLLAFPASLISSILCAILVIVGCLHLIGCLDLKIDYKSIFGILSYKDLMFLIGWVCLFTAGFQYIVLSGSDGSLAWVVYIPYSLMVLIGGVGIIRYYQKWGIKRTLSS